MVEQAKIINYPGNVQDGLRAADVAGSLSLPLDMILQSIGDLVEVIDTQGIIRFSRLASPMRGEIGTREPEGQPCWQAHCGVSEPGPGCPLEQVLKCGEIVCRNVPCPGGQPSKKPLWESQHLYPIRESHGRLRGVLRLAFGLTKNSHGQKQHLKVTSKQGIVSSHRRKPDLPAGAYDLSRRELQVLNLMAEGLSNTQIARQLGISHHTVKSHVVHIFNKLEVNQRTRAVLIASRLNLI